MTLLKIAVAVRCSKLFVLFGDEVAKIVESCTDTFDDPKPASRPRKEAYLASMARKPTSAKLVAGAGKLHNLVHTLRDIEIEGVVAWRNRMKETPNSAAEKQVWYYLGCLGTLSSSWSHPILANTVEPLLGYATSLARPTTWPRPLN